MFILTALAGFPCMVPIARAVVRNALPGCPRRDDAEHIVSAFVTASVRHSRSRGAQFWLNLDINPGRLRIEVMDGGPFGYPPPRPPHAPASRMYPWIALYQEDHRRDRAAESEEYSLSLAVINAATDDWGTSRYPDYALWWAELAWPDAAAHHTVPAPAAEPDQAPTADGHGTKTTNDPPTPIDTRLFLADPAPRGWR